jgi:hypothetical protein
VAEYPRKERIKKRVKINGYRKNPLPQRIIPEYFSLILPQDISTGPEKYGNPS